MHTHGARKKPTYLFERIHFCTEVGGFQHAQQNVQPQVIDRRDQVRLEAHTQQFDPRQELRDTHQPLFETKQQKRDKQRHWYLGYSAVGVSDSQRVGLVTKQTG